ncbi:MAG: aerobic carbon-monoxide dehydrogenase small subunit [Hyphomicrobiales bacterium]|jgi:carbon-monoxide dehydrogenase small subunit
MSALPASDAQDPLTLTVNGRTITARAEPRTNLADFLRDGLDLTGTHLGCEHGVCGACTILLDGEPARACLTFAVACDGSDVETIEGLDHDEITTELRAAFTREHALQCGYCTPGMLIAARDLVIRLPDADERRVRLGLSGNLCRCTGYVGIVRAVRAVITERRARGIAPQAGGAARCVGPVGAGRGSTGDFAAPAERRARDVAPMASAMPVADFTPANSFAQDFVVAYPADEVFTLFGRIEDVAGCLPGAFITARPSADSVEGGIRVQIGPIAAAFAGTARITRDEATRSGRIMGVGADAGGRSTTQGMISYRVLDGPEGTARVALQVGYTLKGALAQFSRPGLVRDLAARITVQFAANLEARLAGRAPASSISALNPLSLLIGMLRNRIASWFSQRT